MGELQMHLTIFHQGKKWLESQSHLNQNQLSRTLLGQPIMNKHLLYNLCLKTSYNMNVIYIVHRVIHNHNIVHEYANY